MKTNRLYLTGCLKHVEKFDLNYLVALRMSMKLKDLLRKLKALLEVNNADSFAVN